MDEAARQARVERTVQRHQGQADYCKLAGVSSALIKPTTLMNRSGRCVRSWLKEYPESNWVVVFDDISLEPGTLRYRSKGTSGGHRGVLSIIEAVGGEEFDRLKIGVGSPPAGEDAASYVLTPPTPGEEELIAEAIQRAVRAIHALAMGDHDQLARVLAKQDGR